jgi:hypothetical protein
MELEIEDILNVRKHTIRATEGFRTSTPLGGVGSLLISAMMKKI